MDEPEQVLRPQMPPDVRVVSFAFGASHLWSHFTVYFSGSDNRLYSQCPFVPRHLVIPPTLVDDLLRLQENEVARLTHACKVAHSLVGDSTKMVRKTTRHLKAATRILSWLQGGMTDVGLEPLLQSLLAEEEVEPLNKMSERVCDMAVIPAKFPVLCVLYESGLLEMRLQLQCASPAWVSNNRADTPKSDMSAWVVLFDRVDVAPSILKGLGASVMPFNAPLPMLLRDPVFRDRWFIAHAGGVDYFSVDKLERTLDEVERALQDRGGDGDDSNDSFPVLPRADLNSLLQQDLTVEDGRLQGFDVIAGDALTGDGWFACLDIGGSWMTVDLVPQSGEVISSLAMVVGSESSGPTTEGAAAAAAAPLPRTESPWQRDYREWDQRRPKAIARVDFRKKSRLDQLALFKDQVTAYGNHAIHLKEGQMLLQDAAKELEERRTKVTASLSEHAERMKRVEEREAAFAERVAMTQRNHENLVARVAAIESICVLMQPTLSRAERAYHQELRARSEDIAQLELDLQGLEKFVDAHPEMFQVKPSNISLDDRQLRRIEKHLETQNEELDKLVNQVKQLQLGTK